MPGSAMLQGVAPDGALAPPTLVISDTPLMEALIVLPALPAPIGIKIAFDDGYFMPYIMSIESFLPLYQQFLPHHRHNVWIVLVVEDQPINVSRVVDILAKHRSKRSRQSISMLISKHKVDIRTKLAT